MEDKMILQASFSPKYKPHKLLSVPIYLLMWVWTIVLIPLWFLGIGQWYSRKAYSMMYCELREKSLYVKKGVFVKRAKHIPLDKITDITIKQGPLMRRYGIHQLVVETAGQSNPNQSEGSLIGIEQPHAFRDAVIAQRERIVLAGKNEDAPKQPAATLDDIYEILRRIESKM